MLPGPGPAGSVLCMIRERHVILKAVLHSGIIIIVKIFLMLVWEPIFIAIVI